MEKSLPPLSLSAWLRIDLIERLLAGLEGARSFLEVGCGGGALGARLADRYDYCGYEPDPASFALASARIGDRGAVVNGFLPSQPTRTFDVVGAFEVLEHIEDDAGALASWRRWLETGGWLLLSVPAHAHRFGAGDRLVGHYRRYSREGLGRTLRRGGLQPVRILSYGFPLGYALEAGRNHLAARRQGGDREQRTAASGRLFQPPQGLGWATRLATAPFRLLQRPFTGTELGTGLVALARSAP